MKTEILSAICSYLTGSMNGGQFGRTMVEALYRSKPEDGDSANELIREVNQELCLVHVGAKSGEEFKAALAVHVNVLETGGYRAAWFELDRPQF